jgi:hypothetical protein
LRRKSHIKSLPARPEECATEAHLRRPLLDCEFKVTTHPRRDERPDLKTLLRGRFAKAVREGNEGGEGAPCLSGVAREASNSEQPLNSQRHPTQDGGDLWQSCPERVWGEARLGRIFINVYLEEYLARSAVCSAKLRNARKEFYAINRADAIGGNERSTHLIALQRTDQVPPYFHAWAQLCNRRALLLQLLDAVLTEGTLSSINRLSDALSGDTLGDGKNFNAPRLAATTLLGSANAGVKRR